LENTEYHVPVLFKEAVGLLLENKETTISKLYVDCTLGGGGYSEEILAQTDESVKVLSIDRDVNAIEHSEKRLEKYKDRISFHCSNFAAISEILKNIRDSMQHFKISGVILDLGLSSYQLGYEEGFSYQRDTVLDMRASKEQELTAKDVLNNYSEKDLLRIFKGYGELRYYKQIVRDIAAYRRIKSFEKTSNLVDLLSKKIPKRYLNRDLSKIFQALRIEVNDELENLNRVLNDSTPYLEPGGKEVVVSYHSLEDRMVKNFFRNNEKMKVVTKKPITPSLDEIKLNTRARSAKLRAAEKIE
jgi:16S rRNA (cytosine1402-N4)-methyltransferase